MPWHRIVAYNHGKKPMTAIFFIITVPVGSKELPALRCTNFRRSIALARMQEIARFEIS